MDPLPLTPCTLCSSLFPFPFPYTCPSPTSTQAQQSPPASLAQIDPASVSDVVFITGLQGPIAHFFGKYLEYGLFCPPCHEAITSLHFNMNTIREFLQKANESQRIIQDGINKSIKTWAINGNGKPNDGIGQFFLDEPNNRRQDCMSGELLVLDTETATSSSTPGASGSGWSPEEEAELNRLIWDNIQKMEAENPVKVTMRGLNNDGGLDESGPSPSPATVTAISGDTIIPQSDILDSNSPSPQSLLIGQQSEPELQKPMNAAKVGFIPPKLKIEKKKFHCYPCGISFQDSMGLSQHSTQVHRVSIHFSQGLTKAELERRSKMKELESKRWKLDLSM